MKRSPSRLAKPMEPGSRFGYLTVMRREGSLGKFAAWRCRCDCGVEIVARGQKLRRGERKACAVNGHWFRENCGRVAGYGLQSKYPNEYKSWEKLRERCNNPKSHNYANYGGRGIVVCDRWSSFEAFIRDMGEKPSEAHTIERRDVNGNYEPDNCRWATRAEQSRNMRNSVFVELNGQRVLLMDVAKEFGLELGLVYGRLKNGWGLEEALSIPSPGRRKKHKCKLA